MNNLYESYLKDFRKEVQIGKKSVLMFIRHYHAFDLFNEFELDDFYNIDDITVVKHIYSHSEVRSPFEPYLGWIRDYIIRHEENIEEFLEKNGVYSMHREIFKSYFETGICKRNEEFIDHSYKFENKCVYDEILRMIEYCSKRNHVIFVLDKMHLADASDIKLLIRLLNSERNYNFLACFNENYPIRDYVKSDWDKLNGILENKECVYDYDIVVEDGLKAEKSVSWKLSSDDYIKELECIHNKIEMLQFVEAYYYLDIAYEQLNIEKLDIEEDYEFLVYMMLVETLLVLTKFDNMQNGSRLNDVLLVCEKMKTICANTQSLFYKFVYCYELSRVYMIGGQEKNTLHYINETIKIAQKMRNQISKHDILKRELRAFYDCADLPIEDYLEICLAKAEIILVKTNNDYTIYSPEKNNVPYELIDKLREINYYDHLAEILNLCCEREPELYRDVSSMPDKAPMLYEAIKIGKKIGNNAFLRSLYRINIMRASSAACFDTANYFCKKVLEVIGDDELQAAYTYMGMGFNSCTIEQYELAHEYFSNALKTCYKYHDTQHVAECLYNLGLNCMLANDYYGAIDYLSCAIRIMDTMGYAKLYACNITKLFALRTICYFRTDKTYLCYLELKKIERNIDFNVIIDKQDFFIEDKFFYFYIKSLIDYVNRNYEEARICIDKAHVFLEGMDGMKFFMYITFMCDKVNIYRECGLKTKSNEFAEQVMVYCDEHRLKEQKERFMGAVAGSVYTRGRRHELKLDGITLENIINMTEIERIKKKLEARKAEEDFYGKWQNLMSNPGETVSELIDKALNAFEYNYNIDGLFMIYKDEKGKLVSITKNVHYIVDSTTIGILWGYFENTNRESFFMTANSKNYDEYSDLLNLFKTDRVYSLMGIPFRVNNKLEYVFYAYTTIKSLRLGTERDIFQILHNLSVDVCERLLRQFIDAIHSVEKTTEIKKMNKMLKQIAHTDMLTGLLNRKGLEEELKRQFKADSGEKINSNLLKSKLKYNFYFVLYIDLDNFKYCNDTFGHDVGDAVLKAFASLLERLTSTNNGLAIRYGGDEFIVVFKNMDRNTVIKQIENIYQMLLNENSFVDVICEEMNELVNIEEKNRICCSVGVAGFKTIGNDGLGEFYKALENADKALYHVKKTKKGTYSFYTK